MLHLEDKVEEIATGRPGHIDNIHSEGIVGLTNTGSPLKHVKYGAPKGTILELSSENLRHAYRSSK
jgi:hypothetical protein